MFQEAKRTVVCPFLGRMVEILELYQIEGTKTCQIEVNPFHWHCRESQGCGSQVCEPRRDYFLLKRSTRED